MNIVADLIAAIKARRAEIGESLISGQVHSFDTYNRMVGTCQGLQESLQMIEDLLRLQDEDRDL